MHIAIPVSKFEKEVEFKDRHQAHMFLISFVPPVVSTRTHVSPKCCEKSGGVQEPHHVQKRLRARVAYDGTGYRGWQLQAEGKSIQKEMEKAFSRRYGERIRVVGASRTDAGVHARGQACHLDLPPQCMPTSEEELNHLQFVVNRMLPDAIQINHIGYAPRYLDAQQKSHLWSALFDTTGKLYSYRFSTAQSVDPMERLYCHREWRAARYGFCEARLREAADKFVGSHDFTAFANSMSTPPGMKSPVEMNPVRSIRSIEIVREDEDMYRMEFLINGALYKMIRNIMGTLLDIACYKLEVNCVDDLFASKDRRNVPKSAPAQGLCLEQVFYDGWDM